MYKGLYRAPISTKGYFEQITAQIIENLSFTLKDERF
jgi:hypothetical protein